VITNFPPGVGFYLAQLRAERVGGAVTARLDVVSRPNPRVQEERGAAEADEAKQERYQRRLSTWKAVLSHLEAKKPPFRVPRASVNAYTVIRLRPNFSLTLELVARRHCVHCGLYFNPWWKAEAFAQLQAQKAEIESEIGAGPLEWRAETGQKKGTSRIFLEAPLDPSEPANLDRIKEWFAKYAVVFYQTLSCRVKALTEPEPPDDDDGPGTELQRLLDAPGEGDDEARGLDARPYQRFGRPGVQTRS
jgi:hypothetical protein